MRIPPTVILSAALAALAVSPALAKEKADGKNEQKVQLQDCPRAVQQTVQSQLAGGKIEELEKSGTADKVVYKVEIDRTDGTELKLKIASDGTVLKSKSKKEGKEEKDGKDKD